MDYAVQLPICHLFAGRFGPLGENKAPRRRVYQLGAYSRGGALGHVVCRLLDMLRKGGHPKPPCALVHSCVLRVAHLHTRSKMVQHEAQGVLPLLSLTAYFVRLHLYEVI